MSARGTGAALHLQFLENLTADAFVTVKNQLDNKRHNLFYALKIVKVPAAVSVMVNDGGKRGAVTAYGNVAARVFCNNFVDCTDISFLNFAQTFAAFKLVCKIAPLVFGIFIKAVQPFVTYCALAQIVIGFDFFLAYCICYWTHGVHAALVWAGKYQIYVFVLQKVQ